MRRPRRLLATALLMVLAAMPSFAQKLKIGFSIEANNGERWQTDLAQFQERAKQLGADVLVRFAAGSDDLQFKQVQEMLKQRIDVLVVLPHNTETSGRIVQAAHAQHVPVISYDRLIDNAPVDLYVGFDLFSVGTLQAQALVEKAPKGNYILLGGSPLDINSKVVRAGQMKVLQPYIDRGDIQIVSDIWVPDWSPTQAYVLVLQALDKVSAPIAAIVASNDGIAGSAIQALQDKNRAQNVLVSGQDADFAAVVRLFDGSQSMTVYKPLPEEARVAATAAVQLAKHQKIECPEIPNGSETTKAILLTPIAVNRENAKDTVIKDGFQKLEMLKQALPKEKWAELDGTTTTAAKN